MFSEFQPVALVRDISAAEQAGFENVEFKCGDAGVLVDFQGGKGSVAVEFNMGKAHTADVLFISESDIRPIKPCEVWHTRPLNPHCRDADPAEWEHGSFNRLQQDSDVVFTRNFRDAGFKKGDMGVVTACDTEAGTYQVQVAVGPDWNGPLLTVKPEDIRLWERDEIATVRESTSISPTSPTPEGA